MTGYLGLDLAWGPRARTGIAALDQSGRLVASGSVVADDEIAAFVAQHCAGEVVAAIDAPLIVPNATGRRDCEALVSLEFGRYNAGAYPANRSRPYFDPPRAATLAERFGWDPDPTVVPLTGHSVAIEVYPHPAMVILFGLGTVLPYKAKPGRGLYSLKAAFAQLLDHLERVCGPLLGLADSPRWGYLRRIAASATRKSELGLIEDEIDAILCAYLAWLWGQRDPRMRVLGDVAGGYIVVPGRALVPPTTAHLTRAVPPRPAVVPSELAARFRLAVPHLTVSESMVLASVAIGRPAGSGAVSAPDTGV